MLNIKTHQTKDQSSSIVIELDGVLDENAVLPEINSSVKGNLIIDLEKLSMINSLGCRKWVHWIRPLAQRLKISFIKCSPVVVRQINVLVGFVPAGASVDSIYVPYYCEHCGFEHKSLYQISENVAPEEIKCPSCPEQMGIDVIKEKYFNFLAKKSA